MMKASDVITVAKALLRNCAGWEGDEIANTRKSALDYYLQRARGDEILGRSTVVSGDVSASVEANLAAMVDAYSTDHIAEYDALSSEDEEQAALESDIVAMFIMKRQNGFLELVGAMKNSLLLRNGFIKVWVDRFVETITRIFDDVAPEVHGMVAEAAGSDVVSYDDEKRRLRARRKITHKRFRACSVAPECFFYPKNWDSFDLQEVPGCFELHLDTRSELVRMGFDKTQVSRLTPVAGAHHNTTGNSRNVGSVTTQDTRTIDASLDLIEWFEGYVLLDVDGDGIAERRKIAFSYDDSELLEDEPEELVPYGAGATLIMPNRVTGISDYDKLQQTQDEHTGLKRANYDNINTVTKNRTAYLEDKVNADDMNDGRTNGNVRVHGVESVQQALMPFTVADNSPSILANIEALKRERSELGGAALDLASGNAQIGGDRMGSLGLDRAYSVMEQLASLKTRIFGATLIRSTWLIAHAVIRKNYTEAVSIKHNGGWKTAVPSEWQPRECVTVRVGMSPGERKRLADTLEKMLNWQVQLAGQGMDEVLVSVRNFYRTLMTWARVNDVRNPEQFYIDPQSDGAVKALAAKSQLAQASEKRRQSLMDRAIGTEETRVALDKYKHDSSLQHDYWADVLNSEIEEAKIVGSATTELLKQQRESARNVIPIKPVAPAKGNAK